MKKNSKIFVAGASTLIGSALMRELKKQGYTDVLDSQLEPELTDALAVDDFFKQMQPEYVFTAAGRSGGIQANQNYPAELIRENLLTGCHIIHSAYRSGVRKLLYLASSCSYPKYAPQPMQIDSLFSGALEPTSEAYGVAKIAGMTLCKAYHQQYGANFFSAIPGDLFGPGDDFDLEDSHVMAALIRKIHEGKKRRAEFVDLWGTGTPRRGFIFIDDVASACIFLMKNYESKDPINVGGQWDLSVRETALLVKEVIQYEGQLRFDSSKPDGIPVKSLDSSRLLQMGWRPGCTSFREAIAITYDWFLEMDGKNKKERATNACSTRISN